MAKPAPVVYLLHGEDEFAITQFVSELEGKLGDPSVAVMNITRLDGQSFNPDELLSVASAMPFLTNRRLVILVNPTTRLNNPAAQQRFREQLSKIPETTALVLIEYKFLTEEKERKKGKIHWLERWAKEAGERVLLRAFHTPKGGHMASWIQEQARAAGGQFTPKAAALLGALAGDDPRLARQEIDKLLVYVDYRRPVEPEDVENLTADQGQGDIFAMVDALSTQDGRKAIEMLHRLLETQDPYSIFGMIVRQFRLLLLAREALDQGVPPGEMARELKVHPFVAEKTAGQARQFSLSVLESVYRRLLDVDTAMKTSQTAGDLALDTLVAAFTSQKE